ncbi:MAG: right-handed parallel beta-helix repeat-containing protein [Cyanobacteria bacterium]|jgi:parallel beta-helix repeat protein|nr:right-handed parallel beta-helix repeat-containing protein [Cyanobacteria bacterium GSL.Bin1]
MKYGLFGYLTVLLFATESLAQPPLAITVNSNQDAIAPDTNLTLREAIALSNGSLTVAELTTAERQQISPLPAEQNWRIQFQRSPQGQQIELTRKLPPLTRIGLSLQGAPTGATPAITLTPAPGAIIAQGLTIAGDNITVRGFSLYGFQGKADQQGFPAADILVAPPDPNENSPPKGVRIERNWLGVSPDTPSPQKRSSFGVVIFAGEKVTVRYNQIRQHQGSGILTMVKSTDFTLADNTIAQNGQRGMADGIRLEGKINGTRIDNNRIAHNGGSGIYLFQPEGATVIKNNQIVNNSQRRAQAAIYLMGSDHQVLNNTIDHPKGAGVVVAAVPKSLRNIILGNRFENLDGLSIDLITRRESTVRAYDNGDGKNPPRNSLNRNRDTANRAIATPEFLAPEFYLINNTVYLDGTADPNSEVTLYRVGESKNNAPPPLLAPIATTKADVDGKFSFELNDIEQGARLSAIATHPDYGTSEPADEILIQEIAQSYPIPLSRGSGDRHSIKSNELD